MNIFTNINAISSNRMANRTQNSVATALQRLASGSRINSAKDDAAGLAISERLNSRIRGLNVGMRNVNDGISMLQTAEGALKETSNLLQRMRELAVQAANAGVVSYQDRQKLQLEVKQLRTELNRIAENTEFNGVRVLNDYVKLNNIDGASDEVQVVNALKTTWLEQSENLISTYYGLDSSNRNFDVDLTSFTDGAGGTAARVAATGVGAGVGNVATLTLEIDMADFTNVSLPNGGNGPSYYDRTIAHELTHAVMIDQTDTSGGNIPTWFMEGTAEFIQGGDENVVNNGGLAAVMAGSNISGAWGGGSIDYAKAYLATRYLHLRNGGYDNTNPANSGIGEVMDLLNQGQSLDTALQNTIGMNTADFLTDFNANGAAFLSANGLDLTNSDTGAIGGADAEAGIGMISRSTVEAETVVADIENYQDNPTNFNMVWPFETFQNDGPTQFLEFQVGSDKGETIRVGYAAASSAALDISAVDVAKDATSAIVSLDNALDFISQQRARIGAQQNRLEAAVRVNEAGFGALSASRSRIQDADFATETAAMTRGMILTRASTAMLSQAQTSPQMALDLLNQSFT